MGRRVATRTCPLCEATCGLSITLFDGVVERIAGDQFDVFSKGYMCPKGATLGELQTDPDWLRMPLIKRDGRFVEVPWDEAFNEVDRLLRAIIAADGPDAVAMYVGNPTAHNLGGMLYLGPLAAALRSRNFFTAATLDNRPKDLANALLYGHHSTMAIPDIDRTDFLLILGANPMTSNGSLATAPGWPRRLRALQARGGKLVVIDPVRTKTAQLADQHVVPRVGSDAALLMGIVHVLFDEDLVCLGGAAEFVRGIDELSQHARGFSPESVAEYTGVDPVVVRRLARKVAAAPSACVYGRMGTTTTAFGSIGSWLIDAINILTGNFDRPGGVMFPLPASGAPNTQGSPRYGPALKIGRYHTRVRGAPELFGDLPMGCLAEEIDTPGSGRIRGLLTVSGNPVVSSPNSVRMDGALQRLDAFIAIDPYITDSTRHAHVVLPPPPPLQRPHYDIGFTRWAVRNVANFSPAVLPLLPNQMDEWAIMCCLIALLDGSDANISEVDDATIGSMVRAATADPTSRVYGRDATEILDLLRPRTGPERILDFMLRTGPYGDALGREPTGLTLDILQQNPHGVDFGPLKPRLPEFLRTPDGLINVAPEILLRDLDRLRTAVAAGPTDGLVLIGRRHLRSNNSWAHNTGSLMTGRNRCTLLMNPDDASARGLESGDTAMITSRAGETTASVEVTERIAAGVVSLPHGWLHSGGQGVVLHTASQRPGVNSNRLSDEYLVDEPSWTSVLNGIPVVVTASCDSSSAAP